VSGDTFDLKCPLCDKHYTLPLAKVIKNAGKSIRCPRCHERFVIPNPLQDEPPSEHAPEQLNESAPQRFDEPEPAAPIFEPTSEPAEAPVRVSSEVAAQETIPPVEEMPSPPPMSFEQTASEGPFIDSPTTIQNAPTPEEADDHAACPDSATPDEAVSTEVSSELPETFPIEAPPPQLPPVPVSSPAPPKPRRGARASVTPVFALVQDEPEPRRRGRFGARIEPPGRIEPIVTPVVEPIEPPIESHPTESPPTKSPLVESTGIEAADHEQPVEAEPIDKTEPIASAEPESDGEAPVLPSKTDTPIRAAPTTPPVEAPSAAISSPPPADLSAIRRSVALLATMSVIIAVVLVAILLTLLGIIPRK